MDKVVHFEIPADDVEKAKDFYHEVFGWVINPVPEMDYTVVHTGPTDEKGMVKESGFINGGLRKRTEIDTTVVTIAVEDIDKCLETIADHGGEIVERKMKVGEMGFMAYFRFEKNVVGLWQNK
jgi:uncharacterized protein